MKCNYIATKDHDLVAHSHYNIKNLKNNKKTRIIKSLMEDEILSGTAV